MCSELVIGYQSVDNRNSHSRHPIATKYSLPHDCLNQIDLWQYRHRLRPQQRCQPSILFRIRESWLDDAHHARSISIGPSRRLLASDFVPQKRCVSTVDSSESHKLSVSDQYRHELGGALNGASHPSEPRSSAKLLGIAVRQSSFPSNSSDKYPLYLCRRNIAAMRT